MKFSVSMVGFTQNKPIWTFLQGMLLLTCLLSLLVILPIFSNAETKQNGSTLVSQDRINTHQEELFFKQENIEVQRTTIQKIQRQQPAELAINDQVNRLLEQNDQTSKAVQKYVFLLIIIFFVVVPATAILIFLGLFIYKKCTQTQDHLQPAAQINIEQYNIDEMGPYLVNSNDNCSICLDNQVNIRTFCGHFFHAPCLKVWYEKKAQQNRKPTCPVCVGEATNPIKIYCKKCFVSVKIDTLIYISSQVTVNQFDSLQCSQCKKPQNDTSFTQESANDNSQTDQESSVNQNVQNPQGPNTKKEIGDKINKQQKRKEVSVQVEEQMNSNVKINVNHDL